MRRFALALAAVLAAAAPAVAADGARLFALQCKACHSTVSTPMGPTLLGVAGGPVAARADFKYSAALKAKGGTWTSDRLDAYLSAPLTFAPKGRMTAAVVDAKNRAAIVAYVEGLK